MSLPDAITSPVAWTGRDMMAAPERWTYRLSDADVAEIENAATIFIDSGRPLGQITRDLFPLPEFGVWLESLRETLIHGIGFQLITGLPVETYSGDMRATIFCGIGSHIGRARSQNAAGHLLGHVRDVGADINDPNTRIYQTTSRQSFHTDSCDVVGLLCVREAMSGGDSMLASSMTAYNEILKRRPDLAPHLFLPVATDRRGEVPENEDPFFTIPVYSWHRNFLTCIYQRNYIDSAQRFETAPRLSAQQLEALDLLDDIVNDRTSICVCACSLAICSLSIIILCCTTEPVLPTGLRPKSAAICCGYGWRYRETGLCLPFSHSDTGRSMLVNGVASSPMRLFFMRQSMTGGTVCL